MDQIDYISYQEWLVRNNPSVRSKMSSKQQEFFNNIDSEDKSYWLGFLCADGYISIKNKNIEISVGGKDKEHLKKFSDIFGKKLSLHKKHNREYDKTLYLYRFTVSSVYLVTQLVDVKGLDNHKTFTLDEGIFKHIPDHLQHHFIRGYFDGDGTIGKFGENHNFGIISTKSFLTYIQRHIVDNCGINKPSISKRNGCYQLNSGGTYQIICLREWLYKDATVYLERKRDRFFNYKEKSTASGYFGVTYKKETGKWRARITVNNKRTTIGTYETALEAAQAYDKDAKKAGYLDYQLNF